MTLPLPLSRALGHLSPMPQLLGSFPVPWAQWMLCLSDLGCPWPGHSPCLVFSWLQGRRRPRLGSQSASSGETILPRLPWPASLLFFNPGSGMRSLTGYLLC